MKKFIVCFCALLMIVLPTVALAEGEVTVTDPFTWKYLVTVAGAAAFTLLVVQFLKLPLDKVRKIPTRVLVYMIALIVMVVAAAFTTGLTMENVLLAACNAFIAGLTAMGGYELTFAKKNI